MNIPYFIVRMQYFKNGEVTNTSEISYSKNQAIAKHYNYVGEDMENQELSGSSCTVLNWLGENVINNSWGELPIIELEE